MMLPRRQGKPVAYVEQRPLIHESEFGTLEFKGSRNNLRSLGQTVRTKTGRPLSVVSREIPTTVRRVFT